MRRRFSYLIGLAVLLVLVFTFRPESAAEQQDRRGSAVPGDPAERRGALVDQVVFTEEGNPGKVVGRIEVGSRDVIAQCVTMKTAYHQLRQSRNADVSASYG